MPQTDVPPQEQDDKRWGRMAIMAMKRRLEGRLAGREDLKLSQGSCDQYVLELISLGLGRVDALAFAEWLYADLVREIFVRIRANGPKNDEDAPADGAAAAGPPAPPDDDEIPF